jgi:hypothetical protein
MVNLPTIATSQPIIEQAASGGCKIKEATKTRIQPSFGICPFTFFEFPVSKLGSKVHRGSATIINWKPVT